MARRPRIHSRDIQPQLATPKGLIAVARVQRFDWPLTLPTTTIDELGRKLHVGKTQETPTVTVTVEAFDVSHRTISYLTGYTPSTFPTSGASITELKNVDVIGQIRDSSTQSIVNALYVPRGTITGMDASFGVTANSTITYTVTANSKKELRNPVYYESTTLGSASGSLTLAQTPTWLPITSGWLTSAYRTSSAGAGVYLDERVDFNVTGTTVSFTGTGTSTGDVVWVTYTSTTAKTFEALNDVDTAAVQGKYVPLSISVSSIPRVQTATIKLAYAVETLYEMGGLGKPIGNELGVPNVTGDVSVLKTDNDLINILTGQLSTAAETNMEFAKMTLPLKVQLKDPANSANVLLTYYVPSITVVSESDTSTVNQSVMETFSWESTTGELFVVSGAGPW
jgi:hypothetical protein